MATIVFGVVALMQDQHLDWSETLYLVTQIVTTIGYGDIAIRGDRRRLFVAFYALWLLVLVAFLLNRLIHVALDAQEKRVKERLRIFEAQVLDLHHEDAKRKFGKYTGLAFSVAIFAAHLLFGTLFFGILEHCTCSYGQLEKDRCTPETACENGYTISFVESFYMSVMTLTTVGFGDFSPKSFPGRMLGIFWMVSGIVSNVRFLEAMQLIFFEVEDDRKFDDSHLVNDELFAQMDDNQDGTLSENDFIHFCIVQQRLIDPAILQTIKDIYRKIDHNESATITMHDMHRYKFRKKAHPRSGAEQVPCCVAM